MTAEAGLVPVIVDVSAAISTPQGLFGLAILLWLLLVGLYLLAWRSDHLPARWLSALGLQGGGNRARLLGNLLDRTRDLAQNRRVYSEQLEVILSHVSLLVALLDERDFVTYCNKAFARCVGVNQEGPAPLLSLLSLDPEDEPKLLVAIAQARAEGTASTHLRVLRGEATEPLRFDVRLDRVSDIPSTNYLVISLQDVTQTHQTYQALLRARKVDLQGRVMSSLVHDLNNLLFVVRSGTDLVALALPDDHEAQSDLKAIREAATQAASLSAEMLALGRPVPATDAPCSPAESLQGMEKALRRLVGRQITLEIDLPTEPLFIGISANDWQQILLNLVLNATQALGRTGKIRILVSNSPQDTVVLTVEDNGPGIDQEQGLSVLEPFVTTKASQGCVGLGLPTVKSLVEQAGGRIDIKSSRETGTQICVQLKKVKEPRMSADTSSVQTHGNAPRLLVLDDEEQVRRLMVRLLGREGYTIIEAAALNEALEKAKAVERLDVWVTDANVDGSDATTAILEMRKLHPNLAIVLVSGREPDDDKMDFLQEQGVTFLAKPFTPAELRQSIDQAYRHGLATSTVVPLAAEAPSASVAGRQAH